MTNDELANAFKALFDEAHAKAEALPDGPFKRRTIERLNVAHEIMDRVLREVPESWLPGDERDQLARLLETLLKRRLLASLGLARRSGDLISGFEKVAASITAGMPSRFA